MALRSLVRITDGKKLSRTNILRRGLAISTDEEIIRSHNRLFHGISMLRETWNQPKGALASLLGLPKTTTQMNAFNLYSDVTHPILKKYNFDFKDFYQSAEESFESICEIGLGDDFLNYADGSKCLDSPRYILENCSPLVYNTLLHKVRSIPNWGGKQLKHIDFEINGVTPGIMGRTTMVNTVVYPNDRFLMSIKREQRKYDRNEPGSDLYIPEIVVSEEIRPIGNGINDKLTIALGKSRQVTDTSQITKWSNYFFPKGETVLEVFINFGLVFVSDEVDDLKRDVSVFAGSCTLTGCLSNDKYDWKYTHFSIL